MMGALPYSQSQTAWKINGWRLASLALLFALCDGKPFFTIDTSKTPVVWGQSYNITWQNSAGKTWIDLDHFATSDTGSGLFKMNIASQLPLGTTWYLWEYDYQTNPNNLSHKFNAADPTDYNKTDYYAFEVADDSTSTSRNDPNSSGVFAFNPDTSSSSTSASASSTGPSSTQTAFSSGTTTANATGATGSPDSGNSGGGGGISDVARNGAIAGGIVGGAIIVAIFSWYCCLKRKPAKKPAPAITNHSNDTDGEKGLSVVDPGPHELHQTSTAGADDVSASPNLGSESSKMPVTGVRRLHSVTSNTSELSSTNPSNNGHNGITAGNLQSHDAANGDTPPGHHIDPLGPSELSQVSAAQQQPLPLGRELPGQHHDSAIGLLPSELSQTSAKPLELAQTNPLLPELNQNNAATQQPMPVGRELSSDRPPAELAQQQRGTGSPPPTQYPRTMTLPQQLAPVAEFPADHAHEFPAGHTHQQAAEISAASPAVYEAGSGTWHNGMNYGQNQQPQYQQQPINYAPAQSPVPSEHSSHHQMQQQQQPYMMNNAQPLAYHQSLRQAPGQRVVSDPSYPQQAGALMPGQQQQQLSRSASLPARSNFCPNCGTRSGGQHNFCANCGSQLV